MKAELMVHDAEAARTRIVEVSGRWPDNDKNKQIVYHSVLLDEDYLIVGSNIDDSIKKKVANGEYIDFAKLLTKDRISSEEDTCMEMVNRGGMSFWVPISDRESISINNYGKWEQAFRVFSNIYTYHHPTRAGELIQYNHIIHTAV